MKKNIYPAYNPASELIAIPFIVNNFIRGKTIKERLKGIIESAKKEALNKTLTEQEKYVKQIDYDDLDNFFANHFKALENSKVHSFEDKVDYCLNKYAIEAKSLLSVANTVVLEENFLKGAKKTLSIYFKINKGKEPKKSFQSLFSNKEYYDKFILVMENNSYLSKDNKFDIPVIFFSGVLIFLRKKGIIKKVKNIDIVKNLNTDFNYKISEASISSATDYPTKDEEKKLFNDLSKEFMIDY